MRVCTGSETRVLQRWCRKDVWRKMHALVNAFLRCFSFLLPSSRPCVSCCWRVGDACAETNPRARFKRAKPLTYEEVAGAASLPARARAACRPPLSPAPGCVSLAAPSPAPPHGPASGLLWIGGFWPAVERVFGALWVLLRHRWCPKQRRAALRSANRACGCELSQINGFQRGAAAVAQTAAAYAGSMSDSVGIPGPSPAASPERDVDEVITVDQHTQEMGKVTITVAIQAAEDEEPEEVSANNVDFLGGSCSEDELGRHDKSRWDLAPHSGSFWSEAGPLCFAR